MNNKALIGIMWLFLQTVAVAGETSISQACDSPPTVISSVRLFDGETVIPRATVVIQCSTISAVVKD